MTGNDVVVFAAVVIVVLGLADVVVVVEASVEVDVDSVKVRVWMMGGVVVVVVDSGDVKSVDTVGCVVVDSPGIKVVVDRVVVDDSPVVVTSACDTVVTSCCVVVVDCDDVVVLSTVDVSDCTVSLAPESAVTDWVLGDVSPVVMETSSCIWVER